MYIHTCTHTCSLTLYLQTDGKWTRSTWMNQVNGKSRQSQVPSKTTSGMYARRHTLVTILAFHTCNIHEKTTLILCYLYVILVDVMRTIMEWYTACYALDTIGYLNWFGRRWGESCFHLTFQHLTV